jgi:hypothetical protein
MRSKSLVLAALLVVLSAPSAWAVGKGTSMFAIQLTSGTADLIEPESGGYSTAYDHSEVGVQAQYWNMMAEDYAFTVAAGIGFFSETDEPGDNSTPGDGDFKYTQSSFNVRVGGDRIVKIGDRAIVYFGPGIEFWNGKAKFEDQSTGGGELETEATTRFGLSGRIGATMMLSETFGFTMHGGHRIGYASADDQGAKVTWYPSSFDAAGGVVFVFGGN